MDKTTELTQLINWLPTKAHIQMSTKTPVPKRREIWWVHLGQNIGTEMNGKNEHFERPVLVIKVLNTASLFVAPITSTIAKHAFLIEFEHAGIKESVNIFQLRTLSVKRFDRKMSDMTEEDFRRIIEAIREHIVPLQTESPS